jgi:hypothetical protein
VLQLKNLGLRLNGKQILHHLNLETRPSEIHSILGANGTGKSTVWSKNSKLLWPIIYRLVVSLPFFFFCPLIRFGIPSQYLKKGKEGLEWTGLACWPISLEPSTRNCSCEMNISSLKIAFSKPILRDTDFQGFAQIRIR